MLHPLMPFITEEIWLQVAPLAGVAGPTIMLQPYPKAPTGRPRTLAERQVAALKAVVLGIRQIRGELDVPHSRATPVYVRSDRAGDARSHRSRSRATIARVGNLESVTVVASESDLPPCAIAMIDGRTVLAPFARLIDDVSAEMARLEKRRARTQQEPRQVRGEARATPVSSPTRRPRWSSRSAARVADFDGQLAQLAEQLRRLAAIAAAIGVSPVSSTSPIREVASPALVDAAVAGLNDIILGKETADPALRGLPARARPPADRGHPGRRQDHARPCARTHRSGSATSASSSPATCCRPTSSACRSSSAESGQFRFHRGPVFAQLVLADEVNRATPKAQSALLEAMEEHQVTADGHDLPDDASRSSSSRRRTPCTRWAPSRCRSRSSIAS